MTEERAWAGGMRVSDPRVMRALAHPARIEIVDYLASTGAAVTATECAGRVGMSPSAISYHLRELAKYGLVEQAPSRGDGRERLWRSAGRGLRIEGDLREPETKAAERALIETYLARDVQRVRDWVDRQADEAPEWRAASAIMGRQLLLTADELTELNQRIWELAEEYQIRERQNAAPEGARRVVIQYTAIPMA